MSSRRKHGEQQNLKSVTRTHRRLLVNSFLYVNVDLVYNVSVTLMSNTVCFVSYFSKTAVNYSTMRQLCVTSYYDLCARTALQLTGDDSVCGTAVHLLLLLGA